MSKVDTPVSTSVVLYDADAEQRAPFQTERKGKLYNVAHIFGPTKDEAVLAYERARDQRISDAESGESNDQDAMAVTSRSFQAAVDYAISNTVRTEGYSGEPSEKDRAFAVQNILFALDFDTLPLATGEELCPEDDDDSSTYKLRCMFDGKLLTTEHTLRAGSPEEVSEFQSLMSRALLVKGTQFGQTDQRIPSKAKGLGALYDKVKVSTAGYADRVPLHHKMALCCGISAHSKRPQRETSPARPCCLGAGCEPLWRRREREQWIQMPRGRRVREVRFIGPGAKERHM